MVKALVGLRGRGVACVVGGSLWLGIFWPVVAYGCGHGPWLGGSPWSVHG